MKNSTLSIALFVLLFSITGLFLGLLLARFFIPKGVGLAGGAMVLGYGVAGLFIALIAGLIIHRFMSSSQLKMFSILFGLFSLGMIAWVIFKMNQAKKERPDYAQMPVTKAPLEPTTPIADETPLSMGLGMAKPYFEKDHTLYLYQSSDSNPVASDSVVFKNMQLTSGPSWFRPEHLKLDYQILYMRVKTRKANFLEGIVNRETGQTAWVKDQDVTLMDWPAFLQNVFSVEAKNYQDNPVRIKPLTHAEPMKEAQENDIFHAIGAEGDWLKIEVLDDDFNKKGEGWIRWKSGDQLLLSYSLLS